MNPYRITNTDGTATMAALPTEALGTVAMSEGLRGTAWQLQGRDGNYHSVNGDILTPEELAKKRNLWVVYDTTDLFATLMTYPAPTKTKK